MQKKKKKPKKKIQEKKKKSKEREIAREYQVHVFFLILIQHFGCKNLQKSDKKALNIMMHANIPNDHAKKLILASY